MTTINLKEYGKILTGREFGKDVTKSLLENTSPPFTLDFAEIISMGSSFGDELVPTLAAKQNNSITALHANPVVQRCLRDIQTETEITISMR